MDSRIRDWVSVAERLPVDDDWPCALATIDRGDFDWVDAWVRGPIPESVTHWMSLSLLTAEPEPCEDAKVVAENLALDLSISGMTIETIQRHMESYASQVANKRAEELRSQLTKMIYLSERYWWHASARPTDNPGMRKEIDDAKVILAATEPKQ